MAIEGDNPSAADNQQEIPWIILCEDFAEHYEVMREELLNGSLLCDDENKVSDLLESVRDAVLGIDILSREQGREYLAALGKEIHKHVFRKEKKIVIHE